MVEVRWNGVVCSVLPSASSLMEKAIMIKDTAVIKKQKQMFPAVSMRALPAGNLRGSTFVTALLDNKRVMFDMGSKMASAIVVKRDSEPEDTAPYTCTIDKMTLAAKLPHTAILNFNWFELLNSLAARTCSSTGVKNRSIFSFCTW